MVTLTIDELYKADMKVLWNNIKAIEDDLEDDEIKILQIIKKGVHIRVPIHWLIKGHYEERPMYHVVNITGYGKFPLVTFNAEIDEREKLMRKLLLSFMGESVAKDVREKQ